MARYRLSLEKDTIGWASFRENQGISKATLPKVLYAPQELQAGHFGRALMFMLAMLTLVSGLRKGTRAMD